MNEIIWPEGYTPGFTDNFASNEVIVAGLSTADVWPFLSNVPLWPTYYANSANIRFSDGEGPALANGVRFYFETFGFPVEAEVVEYVPPTAGQPGRVAWHGWAGEGETRLDVHHAWLIEDLSGGRVRILTQENPERQTGSGSREDKTESDDQWSPGLAGRPGRGGPGKAPEIGTRALCSLE